MQTRIDPLELEATLLLYIELDKKNYWRPPSSANGMLDLMRQAYNKVESTIGNWRGITPIINGMLKEVQKRIKDSVNYNGAQWVAFILFLYQKAEEAQLKDGPENAKQARSCLIFCMLASLIKHKLKDDQEFISAINEKILELQLKLNESKKNASRIIKLPRAIGIRKAQESSDDYAKQIFYIHPYQTEKDREYVFNLIRLPHLKSVESMEEFFGKHSFIHASYDESLAYGLQANMHEAYFIDWFKEQSCQHTTGVNGADTIYDFIQKKVGLLNQRDQAESLANKTPESLKKEEDKNKIQGQQSSNNNNNTGVIRLAVQEGLNTQQQIFSTTPDDTGSNPALTQTTSTTSSTTASEPTNTPQSQGSATSPNQANDNKNNNNNSTTAILTVIPGTGTPPGSPNTPAKSATNKSELNADFEMVGEEQKQQEKEKSAKDKPGNDTEAGKSNNNNTKPQRRGNRNG